jgi:hypothetical protein
LVPVLSLSPVFPSFFPSFCLLFFFPSSFTHFRPYILPPFLPRTPFLPFFLPSFIPPSPGALWILVRREACLGVGNPSTIVTAIHINRIIATAITTLTYITTTTITATTGGDGGGDMITMMS